MGCAPPAVAVLLALFLVYAVQFCCCDGEPHQAEGTPVVTLRTTTPRPWHDGSSTSNTTDSNSTASGARQQVLRLSLTACQRRGWVGTYGDPHDGAFGWAELLGVSCGGSCHEAATRWGGALGPAGNVSDPAGCARVCSSLADCDAWTHRPAASSCEFMRKLDGFPALLAPPPHLPALQDGRREADVPRSGPASACGDEPGWLQTWDGMQLDEGLAEEAAATGCGVKGLAYGEAGAGACGDAAVLSVRGPREALKLGVAAGWWAAAVAEETEAKAAGNVTDCAQSCASHPGCAAFTFGPLLTGGAVCVLRAPLSCDPAYGWRTGTVSGPPAPAAGCLPLLATAATEAALNKRAKGAVPDVDERTAAAPPPACSFPRCRAVHMSGELLPDGATFAPDAPCRYHFASPGEMLATMAGRWQMLAGGSNAVLLLRAWANALSPELLPPFANGTSLEATAMALVDVVWDAEGRVVWAVPGATWPELGIAEPENAFTGSMKAALVRALERAPATPGGFRLTLVLARYWQPVGAALEAAHSVGGAWAAAPKGLISLVSMWYIVCGVWWKNWPACQGTGLAGRSAEAITRRYASDLTAFLDGPAGALCASNASYGCALATLFHSDDPVEHSLTTALRHAASSNASGRPRRAGVTLLPLDELSLAIPTETVGTHFSTMLALWAVQIHLNSVVDAFPGEPVCPAAVRFSPGCRGDTMEQSWCEECTCSKYTEECRQTGTSPCTPWECASARACTFSSAPASAEDASQTTLPLIPRSAMAARPMSSLARPAPLAAQAESSAGEIQRELTFVVLRPEVEGAGAVPAAPCRRLWCGSAAAGWGVAVLAWACLGLVWLGAATWRRWWGHWEGAKRLRNINWKWNPRFVKARRARGKQERYGGIESERPQWGGILPQELLSPPRRHTAEDHGRVTEGGALAAPHVKGMHKRRHTLSEAPQSPKAPSTGPDRAILAAFPPQQDLRASVVAESHAAVVGGVSARGPVLPTRTKGSRSSSSTGTEISSGFDAPMCSTTFALGTYPASPADANAGDIPEGLLHRLRSSAILNFSALSTWQGPNGCTPARASAEQIADPEAATGCLAPALGCVSPSALRSSLSSVCSTGSQLSGLAVELTEQSVSTGTAVAGTLSAALAGGSSLASSVDVKYLRPPMRAAKERMEQFSKTIGLPVQTPAGEDEDADGEPPRPTGTKAERIPALGFARMVASLHIVLGHLYAKGALRGTHIMGWGFTWVPWFFMLSGYVLTHAKLGSAKPGATDAPLTFLWKRAANIFPLYAFGVVLSAVLSMAAGRPLPPAWVLFLQSWLLQAWAPNAVERALQTQCWFLSALVLYWLAFGPTYRAVRRLSLRAALGWLTALTALPWLFMLVPSLSPDIDATWYAAHRFGDIDKPVDLAVAFLKFNPLCYAHVFLYGMLLARARHAAMAPGGGRLEVALRAGMKYATTAGYVGLLTFFAAVRPAAHKLSARTSILLPLQGMVLAGLTSGVDPLVAAFERMPPTLGEASYAQYVLQFVVYDLWPVRVITNPSFFATLLAASIGAVAGVQGPGRRAWMAVRRRWHVLINPTALAFFLLISCAAHITQQPQSVALISAPLWAPLSTADGRLVGLDVRLNVSAPITALESAGFHSDDDSPVAVINPSLALHGGRLVLAARAHALSVVEVNGAPCDASLPCAGQAVTELTTRWSSAILLGATHADNHSDMAAPPFTSWDAETWGLDGIELKVADGLVPSLANPTAPWTDLCSPAPVWMAKNGTLARKLVSGPEDPKLLPLAAGRLALTFNSLPPASHNACGNSSGGIQQMYLAAGAASLLPPVTLDEAASGVATIFSGPAAGVRLGCSNGSRDEKNWIAFTWRGQLLYIYSIWPHRVLAVRTPDGACVERWSTSYTPLGRAVAATGAKLHGSATASLMADHGYYVALLHFRRGDAYSTLAYKFDAEPPFAIIAVSPPLPLIDSSHAFASGLLLTPTGKAVITYGVADAEARALVLDADFFLGDFFNGVALQPADSASNHATGPTTADAGDVVP